jgi:pimeloyl-ACP methyl ester carboxylesterase
VTLFALGLVLISQPQAIDFSQGKMPALENTLVLNVPRRKNYHVGHSPFQLALHEGLPSRFKEGDSYAGSVWKPIKVDEDGMVFTPNGSSPIYAEWVEPSPRKVLAQFMFGGSGVSAYFVDGVLQPSNLFGRIPLQLTPLKLRAGRHSAIAGSGMSFLLYPVNSKFVFNPKTARVSDILPGELKTYEASVTAINCTDNDSSISLKAQVGTGPIVTTKVPSLQAMNSRIIKFKFRVGSKLVAGPQKLKLWVGDDLPSLVDINVIRAGEAFRRTYIGKVDGAVHAYTVVPPMDGPKGKPMVSFTYGGNPEGSHIVANEFKTPVGYSLIIPEPRGGTWSGLAGRDVMETLEAAHRELDADKTRTYLYGHSMGGHGAYLLASLNPQGFAGVGASAGWISLYSYMGEKRKNLNDPIERMFDLAMQEQRVESRYDQLASIGNFAAVHGDKDGTVPPTESNLLRDEMVKRKAIFTIFEQPGLDHFWEKDGMNQYDFPPLINKLISSSRRGSGKFANLTRLPNTWTLGLTKRTVLVYGTHGSAKENASALEKARWDEALLREFLRVESKVVPDTATPAELKGWNVILIGSSRTNALWKEHPTATALLAKAKKRGRTVDGWMIQTRKGGDVWCVVGGQDYRSSKPVYQLDPRWQEAAFPEWVLFDRSRLEDGFGWVVGAGFNAGAQGWRETGNLTQ